MVVRVGAAGVTVTEPAGSVTLRVEGGAEHVDVLRRRMELTAVDERLQEAVVRIGVVRADTAVVEGIPGQFTDRIVTGRSTPCRVPGAGQDVRS